MTINMINEETLTPQSSDKDVVLSVRNVSKRFCRDLKRSLAYGMQDVATELLGIRKEAKDLRPKEFWALSDISFELRRGEALGLVGKNGSGKSTLLRVIAGLIKPDRGSVEVNGRVAPLIALGAGFNPILTGRENIYANMSILGLSKEEIKERFDEVVSFAEIEDAIDSPVQSYSSGMASRLGFSCAIHTSPDILLIDEVLAVGDIRFRAKCYRKLHDLRQSGTSFVLVSHQAHAILTTCDCGVYLFKGKLIEYGDTYSIMNRYEKDLFETGDKEEGIGRLNLPEKKKEDSTGFDIVSIFFRDAKGEIISSPVTGEATSLCVEYKLPKDQKIDEVHLSFVITEIGGECDDILRLSSFDDGQMLKVSYEDDQKNSQTELQVQMPYLGLKPGFYSMKLFVKKDGLYTLDYVESFRFMVETKVNMSKCTFYQPRQWKVANRTSMH